MKGFITRKPLWLNRILTVPMIRREVETMEQEAAQFLPGGHRADQRRRGAPIARRSRRRGEQALRAGRGDGRAAEGIRRAREGGRFRAPQVRAADRPAGPGRVDGRLGLHARAGLRRGLRHAQSRDAFLVGMAASIGAGISMGFAEALSDDGVLSGRGHPWLRGAVCGLMTTAGGIGHTLPFLITNFHFAMDIAVAIVAVELGVIAWIRHRYMDTPLLSRHVPGRRRRRAGLYRGDIDWDARNC